MRKSFPDLQCFTHPALDFHAAYEKVEKYATFDGEVMILPCSLGLGQYSEWKGGWGSAAELDGKIAVYKW